MVLCVRETAPSKCAIYVAFFYLGGEAEIAGIKCSEIEIDE